MIVPTPSAPSLPLGVRLRAEPGHLARARDRVPLPRIGSDPRRGSPHVARAGLAGGGSALRLTREGVSPSARSTARRRPLGVRPTEPSRQPERPSNQPESPGRGPEPGSPLRLFCVTQTAAESPDRGSEREGKGVKAHPARESAPLRGEAASRRAVLTKLAPLRGLGRGPVTPLSSPNGVNVYPARETAVPHEEETCVGKTRSVRVSRACAPRRRRSCVSPIRTWSRRSS